MKNKEMLMELKKVEPMFDKLIDVAHEIIESTFDRYCRSIDDLIVRDKTGDDYARLKTKHLSCVNRSK